MEDIDHTIGGADIFNGQQSVLWNNIRDSYNAEIVRMYQTLRSNSILSYNTVEHRYEEHQSKWSEAIWMEDAMFKYIDPLINPDAGKEPTAVYLPMMQGSKEEQRKWWLINRFRYMDSKWNAGEALSQVIQLRGYAKANITVTPYADIYPTVKYGSYLVSERGEHDQPTTLICPIDELNDTEIYVYSAPQLASVGDLSPLKVGFADFSMATRLQSIKIGDASASYSNTNLYGLSLGSNALLKTLDVRNCSGLGDTTMEGHTQTTVDLSGCPIIEEVYFGGTKITGVSLPNGGVLRVLSLPKTITSLIVRNQGAITTFEVEDDDYSNITTLRIENCSSAIPMMEILSEIPANSRVRLIGFTITASSTDDVEDFYDYLDTMRGLDENGNNVDTAQVQGVITGLGTITGSWLAEMNARYPYITIEYEHITSKLYYYNGSTLFYTENISDGGNGTYSGTPTKTQDAQYTYTFAGWSKDEDDNIVDANAQTNVTADRNIYACYTGTLRSYTITWVNADSTVLETDTNVLYGTMPTYDGATPTYDGQTATGWNPTVTTVTGDATYTAAYVEVAEITDSWDTIIANIDNGTYSTRYKIGNYKPLDLGTEGIINMQIVAMDEDELASGGTAPLTFIGMELLNTAYKMNPNSNEEIGTGGNGGWENCEMRSYLTSTILPLITTASATVASRLQRVKKIQSTVTDGTMIKDGQITYDKLWIPSDYEMSGTTFYETTGSVYTTIYNNATARIKYRSGSVNEWWLRSAYSSVNFRCVTTGGNYSSGKASRARGVALGFCLGYEQETIEDDWSTILANTNPSATYSIGDTKYVDFGTYGKQLMEIVAFNEDDKADGAGKAKITWLSKKIVTTHAMNATATTIGGYDDSNMKSWIVSDMLPQLQSEIRNVLVPVTKISGTYENSAVVVNGQTTTESLWIPSNYEMFGGTTYENTGARYSKFDTTAKRIKYNSSGFVNRWWLRSALSTTNFRYVNVNGSDYNGNANYTLGVVLGFCT